GLTADEFRAYASQLGLPEHSPGMRGIGFAQRVRPGQAAAMESALEARGLKGVRIWPEAEGGGRSAIVLFEPLDHRNRAAIGYDMFSEPTHREAMERARDTGEATISRRVTLVQEIDADRQAGFLLYVPVYAGGAAPPTVEERREAL